MEIEDKSKLFVFDKKEVFLIFAFMVLITITAFTLGVRVGKGIFIDSVGISKGDVQKSIDLKSIEEESADKLGDENFENSLNIEESDQGKVAKDLSMLGLEEKLKDEFSKVANGKLEDIDNSKDKDFLSDTSETGTANQEIFVGGDKNIGKFTIQIHSSSTRAEAEKYGEPFAAANYIVVINEAFVPGKGNWYRVGIGIFSTKEEAQFYLEKEKSLFRGKQYLINQIK